MARLYGVLVGLSRRWEMFEWCDKRSRTYELRITNALLYQLSYIGFSGNGYERDCGVKG